MMFRMSMVLFVFIFIFNAKAAFSEVVRRAAFDIGSGSYKLKVADVDTGLQKIVKRYDIPKDSEQIKISAADEIAKNPNKELSSTFISQATKSLSDLKQIAKNLGAVEFLGVATGAYRKASNGSQAMKNISQETGIDIRITDEKQESLLGYVAASTGVDAPKGSPVLVWDVGGSSMQFSFYNKDKKFEFFSSELASVSFKNQIVKEIKKKDLSAVSSPNPLSKKEVAESKKIIHKELKNFPKSLKKFLKSQNIVIVGIGGVHQFSIAKNLKPESVDKIMIEASSIAKLLDERIKASYDDEMLKAKTGTKYPETDISNLVLILTLMQSLGIKNYQVVNANLSDGVLVSGLSLL